MGTVHLAKRDPVSDQTFAPKHCLVVRSGSRTKHPALCVWVPRHERVLTDEGQEKIISWASDSQHYVPVLAGAGLHAQIELYAQRPKAWEPPDLSQHCQNRGLWVSLKELIFVGWQRRLMPARPLQITCQRGGTERLRSCWETRTTTHRSTFSRWAALWPNCSRWGLCFLASLRLTKWQKFAKFWARQQS
jgi:hypothetical protein